MSDNMRQNLARHSDGVFVGMEFIQSLLPDMDSPLVLDVEGASGEV